jgi:transcriptional regulator with XRE-family HTH domain
LNEEGLTIRGAKPPASTWYDLVVFTLRCTEAGGLTKAQLARRIEAKPESIRRLFTAPDSNPTMETVFKVASALGYHLELVANGKRSGERRAGSRRLRSEGVAGRDAGR